MIKNKTSTNLWVIFCVSSVESDRFKVKAAIEVDGCDDVLEGGYDPLDGGDVLLLEGERNGGRWYWGGSGRCRRPRDRVVRGSW